MRVGRWIEMFLTFWGMLENGCKFFFGGVVVRKFD
jgi:hypothetical protein